LPRVLTDAILDELPQRAVVFVAGDNDSYPLWYAQQVEGRRRDVTVVTTPLLGAPWYGRELERRYGLLPVAGNGAVDLKRRIADAARSKGRPVAATLMVPPDERNLVSTAWTIAGLVLLDDTQDSTIRDVGRRGALTIRIDTAAVQRTASAIERWRNNLAARPAVDPTNDYFLRVLSCPRWMLGRPTPNARLASLDSLCNPR